MKITIHYKTDKDGDFYATTYVGKDYMCEVSLKSFDEAKEKLIARVEKAIEKMPPIIPDDEEVEVGK